MSDDILESCISQLQKMSTEKYIDYRIIEHLLENLKKLKIIDEPIFLLFDLLIKQNRRQNDEIGKLSISPDESKKCINCGNDKFSMWTVIVRPSNGSGGVLKTGQSVGDLHMQVCTKCKFCHFTKPSYWD